MVWWSGRGSVERAYKAAISAAVWSLLPLLFAAPGHAQSPPMLGPPPPISQPFPGFVSPYEVMRMVHASGFEPIAPPLREGTTYVLRATDFRGILMRVVVDGRTGAFREVARIVPGPGRYGQFYGGPPYGPQEYDAALAAPSDVGAEPPLGRPTAVRPAPASTVPAAVLPPPLPRPRPAALASRNAVDAKPVASPQPAPSLKADTNAETKPETKPETKTETTTNTAPAVSPPASSTVAPPPAAAPANSSATITKPAGPPDGKPQVNSEVVTAPPPATAAPKKPAIPAEPLND
jgi:hypothetical protein